VVALRLPRALRRPPEVVIHERVHGVARRAEDLDRGPERQLLRGLLSAGGAEGEDLAADQGDVGLELALELGQQLLLLPGQAGRAVLVEALPDPLFLLGDLAAEPHPGLRPGRQECSSASPRIR
jgi:hypothetical protein